jgi:hypothetical protein
MFHTLYRVQERRKRMLGWQCTHKDPFTGEWEQIFYTPSSSASTRSMAWFLSCRLSLDAVDNGLCGVRGHHELDRRNAYNRDVESQKVVPPSFQ